eukprot:904519_1
MGTSSSQTETKMPKKEPKPKQSTEIHRPKQLKEVAFKLHAAIDFGTDGCALAFSYIDTDSHDHRVKIYNKWKGNQTNLTKSTSKSAPKKKTKTQLILNQNNTVSCFGNAAKFMYFNLSTDSQKEQRFFERFKMALYENDLGRSAVVSPDNAEAKREAIDTAEYLHAYNGKKVKSEVVFVAAFRQLQALAKEYIPKNITKKPIHDDEIQWLLTVPAIWSEAAKDKMRTWIIKAGLVNEKILNQCVIVYEPDCASLAIQKHYFKNLSKRSQSIIWNPTDDPTDDTKANCDKPKSRGFEDGDTYILIDAGGGTVDIACHKILDGGCVEEIVYPTGDKWGSCYIDDLYIELLQRIFPRQWIDSFKKEHAACFVEILDNFQKAKESFYRNSEALTHKILLPDDFMGYLEQECDEINTTPEQRVNGFSEGKDMKYFVNLFFEVDQDDDNKVDETEEYVFCLTKEKMDDEDGDDESSCESEDDECEYTEYLTMDTKIWKCLFNSKIHPIISHVEGLLSMDSMKDCKFLGLVGGFACSKYFQYRMREHFGLSSKYKLISIIPKKPMLSVVEGAAWMAVTDGYIRARKLKYSYGYSVVRRKSEAKNKGVPDDYINNKLNILSDGSIDGCFRIIAIKNERIAINQIKTGIAYSLGPTTHVHILSSNKKDPKTKMDGHVLATLKLNCGKAGVQITTEFHFYGTTFKVYSYPTQKPGAKQSVVLNY